MFDAKIVKESITEWIADYFKNNAVPQTVAVVGISGGKDSTVTAALCKAALGKTRVLGVLMPNGVQHDIDVSHEVCNSLDINHVEINISGAVQELYSGIEKAELRLNTVAAFNTPARIRMSVLYAVSGIVGGRVANTCNLSEEWVGYSTKFGDSAGDFSPLADLTVTEVRAVGVELGLPERFIYKSPEDGLSGKTDEDNLGFSYDVLDRYIREGVCGDSEVKREIDRLHDLNLHKITPMPVFRL